MRLALLPGLDGTGLLFGPLVASLSGGQPPLIVEYPRSCAGSLSDYVEFAGEALSTRDRWLVLAESFSGPVAARLLADRPDVNISGVIFAASFLSPPRRLLLKVLKLLPLRSILGMQPPDWLVKLLCLGTAADRSTIGLLRQALTAAGPDVLAARLRLLADLPIPGSMTSRPSLYIRPTADRLVPKSCMYEIAGLIRQTETCELDGPHFILQAEPDRCARIIEAFAASIADARNQPCHN